MFDDVLLPVMASYKWSIFAFYDFFHYSPGCQQDKEIRKKIFQSLQSLQISLNSVIKFSLISQEIAE